MVINKKNNLSNLERLFKKTTISIFSWLKELAQSTLPLRVEIITKEKPANQKKNAIVWQQKKQKVPLGLWRNPSARLIMDVVTCNKPLGNYTRKAFRREKRNGILNFIRKECFWFRKIESLRFYFKKVHVWSFRVHYKCCIQQNEKEIIQHPICRFLPEFISSQGVSFNIGNGSFLVLDPNIHWNKQRISPSLIGSSLNQAPMMKLFVETLLGY